MAASAASDGLGRVLLFQPNVVTCSLWSVRGTTSRAAPVALAKTPIISSAKTSCCDVSNDMAHRRVVDKVESNDTEVEVSSGRRAEHTGGGPGAWHTGLNSRLVLISFYQVAGKL